jgi:hypothetical protein
MKKGGTSGNSTQTGLHFEEKVDLVQAFENVEGYAIEEQNNSLFSVYYGEKEVGLIFKKHALYKFLEDKHIDWTSRLQKKLLPDNVFYNFLNQTIYIVEVKHQQTAGSVDEKLQTCDFKRKQYVKLLDGLNIDVEYIYVFNNWFLKDEYRDVLQYIKLEGCKFYFNEIPLNKLSLPYTDV